MLSEIDVMPQDANGAPAPNSPTKDDAIRDSAPKPTREERAYEVWKLHQQGMPAHMIVKILKTRGYRCSRRTVVRDLADMRAKRQIERATKPDLYKRDLPKSVDEKSWFLEKLRAIIDRPSQVDKEGNEEDRSFVQIQAIRVAATISRDLDRLYGLDLAALRERIDELERTLEDIKQTLKARENRFKGQESAGPQPSPGSFPPRLG